jgi:hypothetical protein
MSDLWSNLESDIRSSPGLFIPPCRSEIRAYRYVIRVGMHWEGAPDSIVNGFWSG